MFGLTDATKDVTTYFFILTTFPLFFSEKITFKNEIYTRVIQKPN